MRFSPKEWKAFQDGETYKGPQGRLQLRLETPATLHVLVEEADPETGEVLSHEATVGHGAEFDITLSGPYAFRVSGSAGSVYSPKLALFQADGAVFTNIDRKPMADAQSEAILKALRQMEFDRRAERQAMKAETQRFLAELEERHRAQVSAPLPAAAKLEPTAKAIENEASEAS